MYQSYASYGVTLHVVTNRGIPFESELLCELSTLINFHKLRTTAYNPKSLELIERNTQDNEFCYNSNKI